MTTTKLMKSNILKKAIFGVACAVFCMTIATTSNAQVGVAIGPKGGISINQFDADDGSYSARVGYAVGAFVNLHLGEVFSIQPEFLVHEKGATQNVSGNKNTVRLNYFSVPVLAKLMLPIDGVFYPHIYAGPVYNYRMNAKYTASDAGNGTTVSFDDGDLKRTEISGAVGAGFDIVSNRVYFNLDGRYNVGFSDLGDNDNTVTIRNRNWMIMAGIGLRFGSPK